MRLLLLWLWGPFLEIHTRELQVRLELRPWGPGRKKVADNNNLCLFQGLENS